MLSKSKLFAEINLVIAESEVIAADTSDAEIKEMVEVLTAILCAARDEQRKQIQTKKGKKSKSCLHA